MNGIARRASALGALALAAASGLHCGAGELPRLVTHAPAFAPKDETTCGVVKSPTKPLVVEWPAMDRVTLEAKAKEGVVAVSYRGCKMEVLTGCRAPVKYAYTPTTLKRDAVHLRDADALYATLPLGAARLEATMERSGELEVDMTIVGRYAAGATGFSRAGMIGPECGRATHVITGLEVGAFDFKAVSDGKVGASGRALVGMAIGGSSSAHEDKLAEDGSDAACARGTDHDPSPPAGCGAVLRVEVTPLDASRADCPAGTELVGDRCVPLVSLVCPAGLHYDEVASACVPMIAPCPPGTTPYGDACVRRVAAEAPAAPAPALLPAASPAAPRSFTIGPALRPPTEYHPGPPDPLVAPGEDLYLSGDYPAASAYFLDACTKGSAFSCSAAGKMASEGRGTSADASLARRLLDAGCRGGDAWGCSLRQAMDRAP